MTTTTEVPGQLTIGEALRDEGIAAVAEANGEWMDQAAAAIKWLAANHHLFSADDLRRVMDVRGQEPSHHNAYGAAFRVAALAGVIEPTDATHKSTRPDAHARRLVVWRSLWKR